MYIAVVNEWREYLQQHPFYKSKNQKFADRLDSSLAMADKNMKLIFEFSDSSIRELYPYIKQNLKEMADFIMNYPVPEE